MVKIVYNLADISFFDPSVFDAVLLKPDRYHKRKRINVQAFFDVDFRSSERSPAWYACMHKIYALPGDVVVAPDVLNDMDATLRRIKEYIKYMTRSDVEVLAALQFRSYDEALTCLEAYEGLGITYIGLGYFTCTNAQLSMRQVCELASEIKARGMKLHLFGWSPTLFNKLLPLLKLADSVDSSSIARKSLKQLADAVARARRAIEKQLTLPV